MTNLCTTVNMNTFTSEMKRVIQVFKVGDLIRITANTHDERMPNSRVGNIVEICNASEFCQIYFTNGETLRIHKMFLEKL